MKIAILIDELAPGSAPKVIGQTCKGLENLGHKCEALVLINNDQKQKVSETYEYHLKGIKIRYLFRAKHLWDFKFPGFSFFSFHHLISFFALPFLIKPKEYDAVIANGQLSVFAAWGLKLFRNIPYIFYVHCDPCTYTLKRTYLKTRLRFIYPFIYIGAWFLDKIAASGAEALIVSGKVHRERFIKVTRKPLETLQLGCFSNDNFTPYNQRQKTILTYDRWDIGNNPEVFLEILESLDEDIKLEIGGFWHPEDMLNSFQEEVRKRNLKDRIKLLGSLNERMILGLCSKVVLHLHPNEEAFGMQTLEAAACGCSIIIPRESGVADLFEHGIHGYFPEKNNLPELIKYIKLVFSDLETAEKMGRKGWEEAKKYNWLNYVKKMEKIIEKYILIGK